MLHMQFLGKESSVNFSIHMGVEGWQTWLFCIALDILCISFQNIFQ